MAEFALAWQALLLPRLVARHAAVADERPPKRRFADAILKRRRRRLLRLPRNVGPTLNGYPGPPR